MNNYIYLRGLRRAEHTVFCVQDGQKSYFDPQFRINCAYSSGQQVKRSILDSLLDFMGERQAPTTFTYKIEGKDLSYKETWSPCDPNYTDQLLGGWMKAEAGKTMPLKRRSPFSFSALRPLHPLLGGLEGQKEDLTFDRSSNPDWHPVVVKDKDGNKLDEQQIQEFLNTNQRTLSRRIWIGAQTRATGLFVYDAAIDLRTLFSVSVNQHEPELTPEKIEELKSKGWIESENAFGKCLVAPKERREKLIKAIAPALLNWRITSNQSRTFSLMETLAVSVSRNANQIASSIRAELSEDRDRSAKPVIDKNAGADVYIAPPCNGYIAGLNGDNDALQQAENKLVELMSAFDYENQMKK